MRWITRKIDSMVGAVFAAIVGVSLSQFQAFVHQYLQRLGGHLDEARLNLQEVRVSERFNYVDAAARRMLEEAAENRVQTIETAYNAIKTAGPFEKSVAFAQNVDLDIARRVATDFQPALPLDIASLVYAGAGMLLGLMVYELIKSPVTVVRGMRRRRRARPARMRP